MQHGNSHLLIKSKVTYQTWFMDTIWDSFVCSCSQRSYTEVKSHQSSSWKISSKCKFTSLQKLEVRFDKHPQTAMAGDTSSLGTVMYFSFFLSFFTTLGCIQVYPIHLAASAMMQASNITSKYRGSLNIKQNKRQWKESIHPKHKQAHMYNFDKLSPATELQIFSQFFFWQSWLEIFSEYYL